MPWQAGTEKAGGLIRIRRLQGLGLKVFRRLQSELPFLLRLDVFSNSHAEDACRGELSAADIVVVEEAAGSIADAEEAVDRMIFRVEHLRDSA